MKHWVKSAIALLESSLKPVPTELNELDWKSDISSNKDKLTKHLSAFANNINGGYLVFGINETTGQLCDITDDSAEKIIQQLSNLAREALEPKVSIDHSIIKFQETNLLLVWVKESRSKPVCLRGKPIDYCFIRSGGTTRQASRQEIGFFLLHNPTLRWEQLRASRLLSQYELIDKLDIHSIFSLLKLPVPESSPKVAVNSL